MRQRDRVDAIAREEQLLLLGDADRDQPSEAELFERLVRRGELSLAAVDEDQIRARSTLSSVTLWGMKSGNITAAMNRKVTSGTPRTISM